MVMMQAAEGAPAWGYHKPMPWERAKKPGECKDWKERCTHSKECCSKICLKNRHYCTHEMQEGEEDQEEA